MPKPIKAATTIQESGINITRGASFLPRQGRIVNVRTHEETRLTEDDEGRIRRQERYRRHKRRYA